MSKLRSYAEAVFLHAISMVLGGAIVGIYYADRIADLESHIESSRREVKAQLEDARRDAWWSGYDEGVPDGQCRRDCQYTHGDELGVFIDGHEVDATGDCTCVRNLGQPDWGGP